MTKKTGDFNNFISLSEAEMRKQDIRANDAFTLAMQRAIKRGRETARPGTFVDRSSPVGALRIRGEVAISACGSPAAMCLETSGAPNGTQAMK
jgi:hypothetical protein